MRRVLMIATLALTGCVEVPDWPCGDFSVCDGRDASEMPLTLTYQKEDIEGEAFLEATEDRQFQLRVHAEPYTLVMEWPTEVLDRFTIQGKWIEGETETPFSAEVSYSDEKELVVDGERFTIKTPIVWVSCSSIIREEIGVSVQYKPDKPIQRGGTMAPPSMENFEATDSSQNLPGNTTDDSIQWKVTRDSDFCKWVLDQSPVYR